MSRPPLNKPDLFSLSNLTNLKVSPQPAATPQPPPTPMPSEPARIIVEPSRTSESALAFLETMKAPPPPKQDGRDRLVSMVRRLPEFHDHLPSPPTRHGRLIALGVAASALLLAAAGVVALVVSDTTTVTTATTATTALPPAPAQTTQPHIKPTATVATLPAIAVEKVAPTRVKLRVKRAKPVKRAKRRAVFRRRNRRTIKRRPSRRRRSRSRKNRRRARRRGRLGA
jgi:hypothetical protein